jgi:hypothetical protein
MWWAFVNYATLGSYYWNTTDLNIQFELNGKFKESTYHLPNYFGLGENPTIHFTYTPPL